VNRDGSDAIAIGSNELDPIAMASDPSRFTTEGFYLYEAFRARFARSKESYIISFPSSHAEWIFLKCAHTVHRIITHLLGKLPLQLLERAPCQTSSMLSTLRDQLEECLIPCCITQLLHNGNTSPAAMDQDFRCTRSLYYGKMQHRYHWSKSGHCPSVCQVRLCSPQSVWHLRFHRLKNQAL